jgi:hypothetical protein
MYAINMNQDLLVLKINAVYMYTPFTIQPMLKAVLYNVHPVASHPYKNYLT